MTPPNKPHAGDGQSSVLLRECLIVFGYAVENIIKIKCSEPVSGVLVRCSFFAL